MWVGLATNGFIRWVDWELEFLHQDGSLNKEKMDEIRVLALAMKGMR